MGKPAFSAFHEASDILGRVEGDHVATALRLCPDPSAFEGPHFVVVRAGRLGRVRIRCERMRSRARSVWYWHATRAVQLVQGGR